MNVIDITLTRFIPGPAEDVFAVWFDPSLPGGPWHGAEKAIMNVAVDGMFYFGLDRETARAKAPALAAVRALVGHFGRFTKIERPHLVEHTWMSEHTQGIETNVTVTFDARLGGTQMTILHAGLPDDSRGRDHERGWTFLLARCADHFTAKR